MFGSLWWKQLEELFVEAVVIIASLAVTTIIEDAAGSARALGSDHGPDPISR